MNDALREAFRHNSGALSAGASGFLLKHAPPEDLIQGCAWWPAATHCSLPQWRGG